MKWLHNWLFEDIIREEIRKSEQWNRVMKEMINRRPLSKQEWEAGFGKYKKTK